MTQQQATQFADAWISAFNAHDLPAIMAHYADELAFYSPFISLLNVSDSGCITSKRELERYFQIGLETYPDLHFSLHNVFVGVDTLAIYYTSVQNRLACEVVQLNTSGKADRVFCHYTAGPSADQKNAK